MAEQGWTENDEFTTTNVVATTLSVGTLLIGDVEFEDVIAVTVTTTGNIVAGSLTGEYVQLVAATGDINATGTITGDVISGTTSISAPAISGATVTGTTSVTGENVSANVQVSAPTGSFTDVIGSTSIKAPEFKATSGGVIFHSDSITNGSGMQLKHTNLATTSGSAETIMTLATISDRVYHISANVTALLSGSGKAATFKVEAGFKNDSGVVSAIDVPNYLYVAKESALYDVTFEISSTDILIKVTGESGDPLQWQCVAFVFNSGDGS